ncbi:MAG: hypothetical protein M1821_000672 [Bathelium mastoideum]|nr:MAG: hypothetical protein M1821_000672 [Bathelium mastoideum]
MSEATSGMPGTRPATGKLYSHVTELHNADGPHLSISSTKMPELELRAPVITDAAALLRILSDRRNIQYDKSCDGLNTPEAIGALITKWRTFNRPLERANVVVVINVDTVGTGGLGWIGKSKVNHKMIGDAGILLDTEYRGKGYAYEALRIIIDHGFRVLGMDEVHIACVDANVAMKGLMNVKLGFDPVAIQDKQFGNDWIWRITKEQWQESPHHA